MHDCICYIDAFSMEPWHLLRLISHNTHVRAIREEARRWLEIARRSTKPGFRKGKGRTGREGGGIRRRARGAGRFFFRAPAHRRMEGGRAGRGGGRGGKEEMRLEIIGRNGQNGGTRSSISNGADSSFISRLSGVVRS